MPAFQAWWSQRKVQLQLDSDPIGADAAALAVAKFASPQYRKQARGLLQRLAVDTGNGNAAHTGNQHPQNQDSDRIRASRLLNNSIVQGTSGGVADGTASGGSERMSDTWTGGLAFNRVSPNRLSDSMRPQHGDPDSWVGPFDGSLRPDVGMPASLSVSGGTSPGAAGTSRASGIHGFSSFHVSHDTFNDSSTYSDSQRSQPRSDESDDDSIGGGEGSGADGGGSCPQLLRAQYRTLSRTTAWLCVCLLYTSPSPRDRG